MLECPYCQKKFSLNWKAYLLSSLLNYKCPCCNRKPILEEPMGFWLFEWILPGALFVVFFISGWNYQDDNRIFPWIPLFSAFIGGIVPGVLISKFLKGRLGRLTQGQKKNPNSDLSYGTLAICLLIFLLGFNFPITMEKGITLIVLSMVVILSGIEGIHDPEIGNRNRSLLALILITIFWSINAYYLK